MVEDKPELSPETISLVGSVSVLVAYWIYQLALGLSPTSSGQSLVILLSAFFSQYIPLAMMEK